MRRAGNLWPEIVSFGNLVRAARRAALGKRDVAGVARFLADLEPNVLRLQRELEAGTWAPGRAFTFEIHDPKTRTITAAPFADRVSRAWTRRSTRALKRSGPRRSSADSRSWIRDRSGPSPGARRAARSKAADDRPAGRLPPGSRRRGARRVRLVRATGPTRSGSLPRRSRSRVARVLESPRAWPAFLGRSRRCLFERFPFFLVYRAQHDRIEVIAVAHAKRRPGYWRDR